MQFCAVNLFSTTQNYSMKKTLLTIICMIASVCIAKADNIVLIFAGNTTYAGDVTNKLEFKDGNRDTEIDGKVFEIPGIGSFVLDKDPSASGNTAKSWIDPEGSKPHMQWGKKNTMTFTINQGVTITEIKMYCTTKRYTPDAVTCSTGSIAYDTSAFTVTWTGSATSILTLDSANGSDAGRVMYMEITYTNGSTGIDQITVDNNESIEYYNLQGVRVNNPENGIYIRRQGSSVQKVFYRE